MATLPAPGTQLGPCAEPCTHRDCAQTRAEAEQTCRVCDKPIGYETRFYVDSRQRARKLGHAACLEAESQAGMMRRIEQRTTYGPNLADEWGPADEETQREAARQCSTEADYRRFVRTWNAEAAKRGDNTRIRSVPDDDL